MPRPLWKRCSQNCAKAMNILVCVKDVLSSKDIQLPANGTGLPEGCRMPNQADECAVEMAVNLRNKNGGRVTIVSVAPPELEEVSGMYLGLGADGCALVWDSVVEGTAAVELAW